MRALGLALILVLPCPLLAAMASPSAPSGAAGDVDDLGDGLDGEVDDLDGLEPGPAEPPAAGDGSIGDPDDDLGFLTDGPTVPRAPAGVVVPGRPFVTGQGLRLAWIQPGRFLMGSADGDADEGPVHPVAVLRGFWLGECEVTQAQYSELMGDNPSRRVGDDRPVEGVSWREAVRFCAVLTERERAAGRLSSGVEFALPTEAQWEYACRAGTLGPLRGAELDAVAWHRGAGLEAPAPVRGKAANGFGLHDMLGNVAEWCRDLWHETYEGAPRYDAPWEEGDSTQRVFRGGGYATWDKDCRSAFRNHAPEDYRAGTLGFRVALIESSAYDSPVARTLDVPREGRSWVNDLGTTLLWVGPGRFVMGSTEGDRSEWPVHEVEVVHGFWMASHEVTQGEYLAIAGKNPSSAKGERLPVEGVTYDEAVAFCEKLTSLEREAGRLPAGCAYALPTEEQWEFACRAGSVGRRYLAPLDDIAWYADNSEGRPREVGGKAANDWGLKDMLGNVAEWTASPWRESYQAPTAPEAPHPSPSPSPFPDLPDIDAVEDDADLKDLLSDEQPPLPGTAGLGTFETGEEVTPPASLAVRGGSWRSYGLDCRSSVRAGMPSDRRSPGVGFRVVLVTRDGAGRLASPNPADDPADDLDDLDELDAGDSPFTGTPATQATPAATPAEPDLDDLGEDDDL